MVELFFSTDVETDGPIPGRYSMLSFGTAVFTGHGNLIATYSANLETLPGAIQNPETMLWWGTQKEAWEACRKNTRPAEEVMPEYVNWIKSIKLEPTGHGERADKVRPVFVGYPAGFDFNFMYWYMIAFGGESPFSFSALDIKTYAMSVLGTDFRSSTKRNFPRSWFGKKRHSHVALDDAIEQGELFCNILQAREEQIRRAKR